MNTVDQKQVISFNKDTPDRPVQLLILDEKTRIYTLNSEVVHNVLNQQDVQDCNIAVISCAGAFRKGKSFLLSFFIRYLNKIYVEKDINTKNWLEQQDEPLSGFSWKGGSQRETTGIWIWSKIFTYQIPNGEKVGVMLMDTQGTFDSDSTMKDNITIFALSTMLSSVQIFNLFDMINECDLQYLQLFTEYGKLALEKTNEKPFQELLFLVRDWRFPKEKAYGFGGGQKYLDEILNINKKPKELVEVRQHLKSCFQNISAFLMPNPGEIATTEDYFNGKVTDLADKFIVGLKEFIPQVLAPQNLLAKKINGQLIKGKHLYFFINLYWKIFQEDKMPPASTILGATAEAAALTGLSESKDYYQTAMKQHTGKDTKILEFNAMVSLHDRISKEAYAIFEKKVVMGDESLRLLYLNKLREEIEKLFVLYASQNESKKAKGLEKTVDNLLIKIDTYKAKNSDQADLMRTLGEQLETIRVSSKEEKQKLSEHFLGLRKEMESKEKLSREEIEKEKERTANQIASLRMEMELKQKQNHMEAEVEKLRQQNEIDRLKHEFNIASQAKDNERQSEKLSENINILRHEMEMKEMKNRMDSEIEKIKLLHEIDRLKNQGQRNIPQRDASWCNTS